jgi:hypothetical protein
MAVFFVIKIIKDAFRISETDRDEFDFSFSFPLMYILGNKDSCRIHYLLPESFVDRTHSCVIIRVQTFPSSFRILFHSIIIGIKFVKNNEN